MFVEVPIPSSAWNKNAVFKFRVDTDGSAAQDWVSWTEMALTTA
ncbi:hypothetical protein PPSIR1_18767 [Plesiocystis pacifica SIR-1]|uniref:Uncharacterized protein n=1 Tax=Plesiocystis pacifica SIR-1 TaxID=391625 RepID=A6GBG9_9BACT|nr:hypothetical protein [Plesiocystis pacifica]EDM76773.1 hypothetical protein PPSIR1_18767 [Plesiocystis pacifica SIR-1]